MSGTQKTNETTSLNFIFLSSVSAVPTAFFSVFFVLFSSAWCFFAPYPAPFTASIIFSGATSSDISTTIPPVRRLTLTFFTPSTEETHFSTLAEHAAQLIPLTSNRTFSTPVSFFPLSIIPSLLSKVNYLREFNFYPTPFTETVK